MFIKEQASTYDSSSDWNVVIGFGGIFRDPFYDQVNGNIVIPLVITKDGINDASSDFFDPVADNLQNITLINVNIAGDPITDNRFELQWDAGMKFYKMP